MTLWWVYRDASNAIRTASQAKTEECTLGPLDDASDAELIAFLNPPKTYVLSQDLMAQLTADDMTKIQAAIAGDPAWMLLWYSMVAQRDPMVVTNARFKAGWSALVSVLGQDRMSAIATALGVTVG